MRDVTRWALVSAYAGAEQAATFYRPHEGGAWFEGDAETVVPAALGLGLQALVGRWVALAHVVGSDAKCVPVEVLNSVAEELIGVVAVAKHAKPEAGSKKDGGASQAEDPQKASTKERMDKARSGTVVLLSDKPSEIEYS